MAERPEEQSGKMGRKKSGRISHKITIYDEAYRQANILRGFTQEDIVALASRAILELVSREIPTHLKDWKPPEGYARGADQAADS